MIQSIVLFILYGLTTSNKRLLLQLPQQPHLPQAYGAYGQLCAPPASDFPCQWTNTILTDQGSGTLECGVDYACCLCKAIQCGSNIKWCNNFKAGGHHAVFGVKDITVYGQPNTLGAVIDCGPEHSCSEAHIGGSWVDTIVCGVMACIGATMSLSQSHGVQCGQSGCRDATFILNSNMIGEIICAGEEACVNTLISMTNVEHVKCDGQLACASAKFTVTYPMPHFQLHCTADKACLNLELEIIIPEPMDGCATSRARVVVWNGITCSANNACQGLKLTIINNGCDVIRIDELGCAPGGACAGAIFNFNAGNSINGGVEIITCDCGPSCAWATGVDICYNNIHMIDCTAVDQCSSQKQTIHNPANDFLLLCTNTNSCVNMELHIMLNGASKNLIRRFAGFDCSGHMACKNAMITIFNSQYTNTGEVVTLYIADLICSQIGSCNDATFIIGNNVEITRITCVSGACNNCFIKVTPNDIGVPCNYMGVVAMITPSPTPSPTQIFIPPTQSPIVVTTKTPAPIWPKWLEIPPIEILLKKQTNLVPSTPPVYVAPNTNIYSNPVAPTPPIYTPANPIAPTPPIYVNPNVYPNPIAPTPPIYVAANPIAPTPPIYTPANPNVYPNPIAPTPPIYVPANPIAPTPPIYVASNPNVYPNPIAPTPPIYVAANPIAPTPPIYVSVNPIAPTPPIYVASNPNVYSNPVAPTPPIYTPVNPIAPTPPIYVPVYQNINSNRITPTPPIYTPVNPSPHPVNKTPMIPIPQIPPIPPMPY